ncbi:MAG: hypothetical protein Ct9H300mP29_1750 [Candidatus Neomarinimicrobiota bacterium]|nr:MAG: hypothetical protein Ct9H300mP29_1750 [Candidatus Neomarinimicrobiota bacterium]
MECIPAEAILTAKGGMTSHAALVARGWGKCCIVGCADLNIDFNSQEMRVNNKVIKKGDWVSMNGSKGVVYLGKGPLFSRLIPNHTIRTKN